MSVCLGTGTGTGITHTASTEGWAVLSLSCSQHMRGTNHLRIQHSQSVTTSCTWILGNLDGSCQLRKFLGCGVYDTKPGDVGML